MGFSYHAEYQTDDQESSYMPRDTQPPRDSYIPLVFLPNDPCNEHYDGYTGRRRCIGCIRDDMRAELAGNYNADGYVAYAVWESTIDDEMEWLVQRLAWLSYLRHNDSAYISYHPGFGRFKPTPKPTNRKTISPKVRRTIMERDAYRCQHCDGWDDLGIDHIVPVSKGGTNDESNLQVLCRRCNSSKGNRIQEGATR